MTRSASSPLARIFGGIDQKRIAPYVAFIQPRLVPKWEGDEIVDVRVEYPADFIEQMLEYGKDYGSLPVTN